MGGVRDIIATDPTIMQRYRSACTRSEDKDQYGFVSYKVSFSQCSYDDALDFCREYRTVLANKHIYVHEIDCTVDYACSFNKLELASYIEDLSDNRTGRRYTVINNDKTVGKNCLSFLCESNGCLVRVKIYNKFIQPMETRSLSCRIGTHIDDWVNNKESPLRKTMSDCLEYGLTRIEIRGVVYEKNMYTNELQYFTDLILGSNKMFKCPINKQWQAFSEALTSTMAIIDLDTKEYTLGTWCNTLTRRVGGVTGQLTDRQAEDPARIVAWIAAHFSLDKGVINIATLKQDAVSEGAILSTTLRMRAFVKIGSNRYTFVPGGTTGCLWYSSYQHASQYRKKTDRSATPPERGLIDMSNIKLRIFDSKVDVRSKSLCEFMQVSPLYDRVSTMSLRRRAKKVETEAELASIADRLAEITLLNTQAIENATGQARATRAHMVALASMHFSRGLSLLDFPKNTLFQCRAYKKHSGKYGSAYLLLEVGGDTYRSNAYINTCIDRASRSPIIDHASGIHHAADYGVMFTFHRGDNYSTQSGHKAATTSKFHDEAYSGVTDETQQPLPVDYEVIPSSIKRKHLASLDLLTEATYTLQGIKSFVFMGKTRYMLQIDGQYYISNYWLEENLVAPYKSDTERSNYQALIDAVSRRCCTHTSDQQPR